MNIMLVENNVAYADLLRMLLNGIDKINKIIWVKDGEEAIKLLDSTQPDLLFIDSEISKTGDSETIKRIKSLKRWRNLPIVVHSTNERKNSKKDVVGAGAIAFLSKRIDIKKLKQVVGNAKRSLPV